MLVHICIHYLPVCELISAQDWESQEKRYFLSQDELF